MPEETIKRENPPNFEDICAVLPIVKDHKGGVFTYHPHVYAPYLAENIELAAHHQIHEQIHLRQQSELEGGAAEWWRRWLADTNFRAGQEIEAYRAQYNFVLTNHGGSRKGVEDFLFRISCDLSGELYGNIMSYGRAESNIRRQTV